MRGEAKISDYRPKMISLGDIFAFYSVSASAIKLRIGTPGKNRVVATDDNYQTGEAFQGKN